MSSKKLGTVKWFHNIKGYGFINSDNDEEIFVHYSEINTDGFKKLKRGEKVEFTLATGDKGLLARDVSLLPMANSEDPDTF